MFTSRPKREATPEFVVSWTQTACTAAAKEQQREAQLRRRAPDEQNRDIICAYLELHAGATMRRIHEDTGLTMSEVNAALYLLLERGTVQRSHRQADERGRPVCWTLSHG